MLRQYIFCVKIVNPSGIGKKYFKYIIKMNKLVMAKVLKVNFINCPFKESVGDTTCPNDGEFFQGGGRTSAECEIIHQDGNIHSNSKSLL